MIFAHRIQAARRFFGLSLLCLATLAHAATESTAASALRTKYTELGGQLASNAFKRPLVMNSIESSTMLKGDIYALIDHPFSQVSSALSGPAHWCDVLILHLNTKYCRPSSAAPGTILDMRIGKKFDQPIEDAHRVDFVFRQGGANVE